MPNVNLSDKIPKKEVKNKDEMTYYASFRNISEV
jgi:hypothetical protein